MLLRCFNSFPALPISDIFRTSVTHETALPFCGFEKSTRRMKVITPATVDYLIKSTRRCFEILQFNLRSRKVQAMNIFLLSSFAFVVLLGSADAILNGERALPKPYYARISYRVRGENPATVFFKSGSIVSDRFILTTNEFFGNATDFQVWVGSNSRGAQRSYYGGGIIRIASHGFGPALIQLTEPLEFSVDVQSVRLVPNQLRMGLNNEQGMVLGFGPVGPTRDILQAAFMRIQSQNCLEHFPDYNQKAIFCAFDPSADFCEEDRGSAMTVISRDDEYLVGIAASSRCSILDHGEPSLFIRMSFYVNRISQIINNLTA